jgi:hypothetical protein
VFLLLLNLVILARKVAVGLCLAHNSTHLHHPWKATQEGIPGFNFTCRDSRRDDAWPHSGDIHRPGIPGPRVSIIKPALSAQSDFSVAIAAIDRPAIGRLKRHFGLFAAVGACGRKHLAREPVAVAPVSIPLRLPYLPA